MSLVRLLLAQMDMHHAGAGIERRFGLARHLLWCYRDVVLFRVGQYTVQRAGDDSLVAHGSAFCLWRSSPAGWRMMRPAPLCFLASTRYRGAGAAAMAAPDGNR